MSIKKIIVLACVLIAASFILAACAGPAGQVGPAGPAGPVGPAGPAGPAGAAGTNPSAADLTCTECHNDTTLIDGPATSYSTSVHATGIAFGIAGSRTPCTGCHTGGGFSDRIAAGLTNVTDFKTVYANPTRIDCRTCHQIHTTYTKADFALETTTAVPIFALQNATYDGGKGNLCANCHQGLTAIPAAAADGTIKVDSTHWGAHHGPESDMLLGVGGSSDVTGTPSPHYSTVTDTCVACHMGGDSAVHTFTPNVANCTKCHADAKNFDMKGAVTALDAKIAAVSSALTAAGLLDAKGVIVVGSYPAAKANALWNYLLVTEDKSHGVHNMPYANALMDAALAALK
jgi:Cytochrome c7 and related cytochrome c